MIDYHPTGSLPDGTTFDIHASADATEGEYVRCYFVFHVPVGEPIVPLAIQWEDKVGGFEPKPDMPAGQYSVEIQPDTVNWNGPVHGSLDVKPAAADAHMSGTGTGAGSTPFKIRAAYTT